MTPGAPEASSATTVDYRELLKRAYLELKSLQGQLAAVEKAQREPIAVIGMACRFPGGANSPEAYWQLLLEGRSAITEIPPDRWDVQAYFDPDPDAPGKMYTRWGGFITGIDQFDPQFFGISPAEADEMDPQQRLALEVCWEALEHAGQSPDQLHGSQTGVFLGMCTNDYLQLSAYGQLEDIDAYSALGTADSVAAGRLSYVLGLHGPTLTVDTACSSSLVTTHLACQSLRRGECDLAIAGGVNAILVPQAMVYFSKVRAMSPDGLCKTFDTSANGYVRGEGCGMVVLKRLSDAQADGDSILAVIRGSAVNHDGRSNGLTAPNGLSQQAVIRKALAEADLAPAQVGYIEAHGTGTSLGDPIEANALRAVLGAGRSPDHPLVVASAKTNIGHLEAAAGVAGLIKVVLSLQNQIIPPHLNFKTLNPYITWDGFPVQIPLAPLPWPNAASPRIAGISSFGFSGTNAHLIVEEAPATPSQPASETPQRAWLLPISARSPAALQALAGAYREYLSQENPPALPDLCAAASLRRSHLPYRLAVAGQTHTQLAEQITSWLQSGEPASPTPAEHLHGGVFVFSGQSGDTISLGRQFLDQEPAFAAALNECDRIIHSLTGWSPITELTASPPSARLAQTDVMQPTLFSLQVALAALWRSWGVEPSAIVGHSVGEIAAAYVAGALSLEQAAQVVVHRSRLMQRMAGLGRMAAIELSPQAAEQLLAEAGFTDRLSVAAINAPSSVVLSGEKEALATILERLADQPIFKRLLAVNYAFHSQQMAPLQDELTQALAGLTPAETNIPFFSTVTGQAISGRELDAAYWGRNIRQTVRFSQAMQSLIAAGHNAWIEIGPHPVLQAPMLQCLGSQPGLVVASLRQGKEAHLTLLEALGELYQSGYSLNWKTFYPNQRCNVPLPSYPWQHQRYWLKTGVFPASFQAKGDSTPGAAKIQFPRRSGLAADLIASPIHERANTLQAFLQREVARILYRQPEDIPCDKNLLELGIDSLMMVQVLKACKGELSITVTPRDLYNRPTIAQIASFLAEQFNQSLEMAVSQPAVSSPEPLERTAIRMDEQFVTVRGLSLCVCTWGPANGQPILCLHGLADHAANWERVAEDLAARGYRVIAFDQRGHGRSEHVGAGGSYYLLDFVADLDAFVQQLNCPPLILVGHSMGSLVAAMFASARPSKIKALVLVENVAPASNSKFSLSGLVANHLDRMTMIVRQPIMADLSVAAESLRFGFPGMTEEMSFRMAERLTCQQENGLTWRWDETVYRGMSAETTISLEQYLDAVQNIQVPITLIAADQDALPQPPALLTALPTLRHQVLHGRHNLHIDAPTALAQIIAMAACHTEQSTHSFAPDSFSAIALESNLPTQYESIPPAPSLPPQGIDMNGETQPLKNALVGVWRLVKNEFQLLSGAIVYPLGENAQGQLIYTENGYMSAHLMRSGNVNFAQDNQFFGTPDESLAAYRGYSAYYGTWDVDIEQKTVFHRVKGSLFPNWNDQNQPRFFELEGDRLTLRTPPIPTGGQTSVGVLVWERVK